MYFVITGDEDGLRIRMMTKEKLEKDLADDYYGETVNFLTAKDLPRDFSNDVRIRIDDWPDENAMLIISGDIITPKPVEVVTRYEL
jgi:hypothetical protein